MIGHLSRAYKSLNNCLFDGELNEVDFISNLSRRCIFYFASPNTLEIGFLFAKASKQEVIDDLVHVMIHVYHHMNHIDDYTPNQYHNRYFCEKALSLGLIVSCHRTRGWSLTYSDPNHKDLIGKEKVRLPNDECSKKLSVCLKQIFWSQPEFANFKAKLRKRLEEKPQKEYQLKYICVSCKPPVIIRSGRRPDGQHPLDVTCNLCKTKFVLSETG